MNAINSALICLLILSGSLTSIYGQLSESATVSLITCAKGDDIYNMYGHSAIRITDPVVSMDQVYNFGIFDFKEPNFIMKFLRGKLLYRVEKQAMRRFMFGYVQEKRSVREQVLNVDQYGANELYAALEENSKPKNKYYLYDFFFDNCTTRLRDLFESEIVGFQYPEAPLRAHTYRSLLDVYTYRWPFTDFGQDLIVGSVADGEAGLRGQCFLPEFMEAVLARSSIGHLPAVRETKIILDHEKLDQSRSSKPFNWPLLIFGILLFIEFLLFIFKSTSKGVRLYDRVWYWVLGIGGLVIAFMWYGTDHLATKENLNLLWMSPLFLFFSMGSSRFFTIVLAIFSVLSLVLSIWLQSLHPCAIALIVIILLKLGRKVRTESAVT